MELPNKKYEIIYADPPWKYKQNWGNGCVKHHYPTMETKEIKNLPIGNISNNNCHLYLWVTNPFLQEGLDVCKAWGFEYKQLLTWVKLDKKKKIKMCMGYYFRGATEHIIFGVKGKLPRLRKDLKNVFLEVQTEHSKKPAIIRDIIIKHSGDLPRIELFARQRIDGWDAWGLEVPKETQKELRIESS